MFQAVCADVCALFLPRALLCTAAPLLPARACTWGMGTTARMALHPSHLLPAFTISLRPHRYHLRHWQCTLSPAFAPLSLQGLPSIARHVVALENTCPMATPLSSSFPLLCIGCDTALIFHPAVH